MSIQKKRKKKILFAVAMVLVIFLLPSISVALAPYVTADLGSDYSYLGTNVRYINVSDFSNLSVSEMKMLAPMDGSIEKTGLKVIGSPTIGSVQRVFSSTSGTTKGVTITVSEADSTVDYNQTLDDYIYTQTNSLPRLYSKIPGEDGVFVLFRFNESVQKEDINDKNDLILLQDATYTYVGESGNRAVLYNVGSPVSMEGTINEGATPYYNKDNFGDTITHAGNEVSLDGYTSFGVDNPSPYEGKYSAIAMNYDGTDTFSILGFVPTILLDGDRSITWDGGGIPSSYTQNSGNITLSLNTTTDITNCSYLIIKSDESYDARVKVDTDKLADRIKTEWNSLGSTKPGMSEILNGIIHQRVGTGIDDPFTYELKRSSDATYPGASTSWSTIHLPSGYGISGYANSLSVVVSNADLNTLVAGTYYVYLFAADDDLTPKAFDRQNITITVDPAAPTTVLTGGVGDSGVFFDPIGSAGETIVATTTVILDDNMAEGVLEQPIVLNAADGQARLMIPSNTIIF